MQAVRDGKSVIIEGMHNDPGLYLYEFAHCGLQHLENSHAYKAQSPRRPLPVLKSRLSMTAPTALDRSDSKTLHK